jgi:hypothetical protein
VVLEVAAAMVAEEPEVWYHNNYLLHLVYIILLLEVVVRLMV